MTYERFEDLPVWKAAIELGLRIFALTDDRVFSSSGGIKDQVRRAVISISNNIAEGFERGTTNELLMFLYIARGSAGEVRSMLRFLDRWPHAEHLKSEISDLIALAESCSRQIRGWADNLQNSDIKGQRHLNDKTRAAFQARRRADEFAEQIRAAAEANVSRAMEAARQADKAEDDGPRPPPTSGISNP
jgi:four helix bundle protein